jgi:acyl carrier protein
MDVTEHDIRQLLADNFPLGNSAGSLAHDVSLLESGVIDSTGILELIDMLEARYGIRVPDDELLPENLDSIDNIVAYVQRKQAALPAGE